MSDTTWPTHGPDFNSWNGDFDRFAALLHSVKNERWWIWDSSLKYLNIRIDTRDNGFLLFADEEGSGTGKVRISPDRVKAAIEKYLDKYPSRRAALAQQQPLSSPAGWKLVPIEPTDAMIEAGRMARMNIAGGYGGPGGWEAMLAAAPTVGGKEE